MTRAEVARDQRDRMLVAIAEAMSVEGYATTSVADVIRRAGVSRETFYEQFASKQECFLAAFDAAGEFVVQAMAERATVDGSRMDRLSRALDAYLELLASNPLFARLFLVEVHAAGLEAMRRRQALQARIVDRMVDLLELSTAENRFACELVVAGVGAMVATPLVAGELELIRELREPILGTMRRMFDR